MSGVFGVVSKDDCAQDVFYGTDYHSHLGTQYGGMAVLGEGFARQIHDISQTQFKSKFYEDYRHMRGDKGIGHDYIGLILIEIFSVVGYKEFVSVCDFSDYSCPPIKRRCKGVFCKVI